MRTEVQELEQQMIELSSPRPQLDPLFGYDDSETMRVCELVCVCERERESVCV
jgi:hypothetical protein